MAKLYELANQYEQVLSMVNDEVDMDALKDTLEGLEGEITDKAESIAKLMKSIEADETAIKAEEERLYNRRKALENRRTSIKEYLEQQLTYAKIDKIKGAVFTISMQDNPPSVHIQDDAIVPEKYYVPQPAKLDKRTLLEDLKAGAEYEGIALEQTRSVRIR